MIQEVLKNLQGSRENQAKFVNTLSFLEYIGARKILKSQRQEAVSLDVLAHAAEEIRHAQSLKKVALKMSEGKLTSYEEAHLLGAKQAQTYIQSIDYGVEKVLGDKKPFANYLLTTLLLEERANIVYPLYENFLAQAGFPGVLRAIIREEDAHLASVNEALTAPASKLVDQEQLSQLRAMEDSLFTQWSSELLKFSSVV